MIFNRDYRMIMKEGKRILKVNTDTFKPLGVSNVLQAVLAVTLLLFALFIMAGCVQAQTITEEKAVRAELGEAENQGYDGMLAIACAIRHRGSLRGVYGYKAIKLVNGHYYRGKRQIGYKAVQDAKTAWVESSQVDTVNGATGWGNEADLNKFCSQAWWNKCIVTARVGSHWFYREVRQ